MRAAAEDDDPTAAGRLLQRLHAAPLDTALLAEACKSVREGGVTVAAPVSAQRAREPSDRTTATSRMWSMVMP